MRRIRALVLAWLACLAVSAEEGKLPGPAQEFASRASKLKAYNAPGWMALANFCEDRLLFEEAQECLRKAVKAKPGHPEAHRRLGEVPDGASWIPAEQAEATNEKKNREKGLSFYGAKWVSPETCLSLRDADRQSAGWDLDFRLDTPRLLVYSSCSLAYTRRVANVLEHELDLFVRRHAKLWPLEAKPKPFKVYLFKDHPQYARIGAEVRQDKRMPPSVTGFFSSSTLTLFVGVSLEQSQCNLSPEVLEELKIQTATHEMVHGMDKLLAGRWMKDLPMWFAEGRADYFCYSVNGRTLRPGALHLARGSRFPSYLEGGASIPLAAFLELDKNAFGGSQGHEHYAIAWAFVHFLHHAEGGRYREGFERYLSGVPSKSSVKDFENALGKKVEEIEEPFKAYLNGTLIPLARAAKSGD